MHPQVIIPRREPVWHPGLDDDKYERSRFIVPPSYRRAPKKAGASVVQTPQRSSSAISTSIVLAYGTNPTAGNLLVAVSSNRGNNLGTVTSSNNTWTRAVTNTNNAASSSWPGTVRIDYVANCNGGADTVTLNTNPETISALGIFEINGCSTSSPLIATNTSDYSIAGTGVPNAGNVTTTQNDSFLVCHVLGFAEGDSAGSGWTMTFGADGDPNYVADYTETRIETATGTFAGNLTGDITYWFAVVAAFQAAGGGGGGNSLFRYPTLNGLGSGGPFFNNPLG